MIMLQVVPAIVSLAVTPFLPETPRYLMIVKQDEEKAQKGNVCYLHERGSRISSSSSSSRTYRLTWHYENYGECG